MKKEEQEQVIAKTTKIGSFLKSVRGNSIVRPGTSTTCSDTLQSEKDETDFNSAAQQQLGSVEQSAFEKTDMYVFDKEAVEESSICITVEDASQYHTSSTRNDQVQTTVSLNKDPALWEINNTLREIIARYGFDQNKSCDFSRVKKYMLISVVSCQ